MKITKTDFIIFSNIVVGMAFVFASCHIRDIHIPMLLVLIISCTVTWRMGSHTNDNEEDELED